MCLNSCSKPDDPLPVQPDPTKPDPKPDDDRDTKAPEISVILAKVNVYGGKTVIIESGSLSIGDSLTATWTDDRSSADKCRAEVSFTEETETKAATAISSGDIIDRAGTLRLSVADEAGNTSEKSITLTAPNDAPQLTVIQSEFNVYGGKTLMVEGNVLRIGGKDAASWTDDHDSLTVTLTLDGTPVESGTELSTAGTLEITVTDRDGLSAEGSITLTAQ